MSKKPQAEESRLRFQDFANEHGLCLDEKFFANVQTYVDETTVFAWLIWQTAEGSTK